MLKFAQNVLGRRHAEDNLFVFCDLCLAGYNAPYLSVYSENAVDVFDVNTMDWIQTMPLKNVHFSLYLQ